VPPLVFVLLRLIGSLALIAPALAATGQPLLPVRGERLSLFWVGQLQVAGFLICGIIGLSIVPAAAASLKISDVRLRPLKLRTRVPVELFMVWRRDNENPLLAALVKIAGELASTDVVED